MEQRLQRSFAREPFTAIAARVAPANEIVSALTAYAVVSASLLVGLAGTTYAADRVTVGVASTISDAPLFIAAARKFFQEDLLDVTIVNFRAATDMVPMLATGQADVVAASASAGFYNAMTSDIKIKIVADKASSPPGYGATKILIRRDHVESQRYKSPADLKGMKVALNAPGVSNTATLNALLKSAGLKYSDVQTVYIPLPDHVAALANKSVDAAGSVEPGPTMSVANGSALIIKSDDEVIPNHETAVLLYSEAFVTTKAGYRNAVHALISAGGAILQRGSQGWAAGWSKRKRGDFNSLGFHAAQGRQHLSDDDASWHQSRRQGQCRKPAIGPRFLQRAELGDW